MPHRPPRAADARRSPRAGSTSAGSPSIRRIAGRLRPTTAPATNGMARVSAGSRAAALVSAAPAGNTSAPTAIHTAKYPAPTPATSQIERAAANGPALCRYRHSTGASTGSIIVTVIAPHMPANAANVRPAPHPHGAAMPPTSSSRRTRVRRPSRPSARAASRSPQRQRRTRPRAPPRRPARRLQAASSPAPPVAGALSRVRTRHDGATTGRSRCARAARSSHWYIPTARRGRAHRWNTCDKPHRPRARTRSSPAGRANT